MAGVSVTMNFADPAEYELGANAVRDIALAGGGRAPAKPGRIVAIRYLCPRPPGPVQLAPTR